MIKFCNEVLKAYRAKGNREVVAFDNTCIHSARDAYSDYLRNELDGEVAKHVPEYRNYLEALKSVGVERFSFDEFAAKWEVKCGVNADPLTALERLFNFSVVGYLKPGGRGGGSEYVWRYRDPRARFDFTGEVYRVHPGFKEALDLKVGPSASSFESAQNGDS